MTASARRRRRHLTLTNEQRKAKIDAQYAAGMLTYPDQQRALREIDPLAARVARQAYREARMGGR